jgi:NAD(P) transhydrogenase subunit beta
MTNESMAMLLYLVAAIFFILALRGLSSPHTARSGNMFGIVGMGLAIITTLTVGQNLIPMLIAIPIILGASIGILPAKKVQMTKMPELVALNALFCRVSCSFNCISCSVELLLNLTLRFNALNYFWGHL